MDGIKATTTGNLDITPAEERSRTVDAEDWNDLADADMKLYPDAMRKKYPKMQDDDVAILSMPNQTR